MAFFARTISCSLFKQLSPLRIRRASCLSFANKSIVSTLARTSTVLVDTLRYAGKIHIAISLSIDNSLFWTAWLPRALAQIRAAQSSFECTPLATSLLFAFLGPPMLGMIQAMLHRHWITLLIAIWRCSTNISLRSNCTLRHLMLLLLHPTSCSPNTIFEYLKDLLSVISKASIFSGAISRLLLFY